MTIFGYTLPEIRKFLIATVGFLIAAAALVVFIAPGFQEAVETLIIAAIGAIGVFALPNPSEEQVYKALSALVGGLLAVVQFYHTIPSGLAVKIGALVYAFAIAYVVWRTSNKKVGVAVRAP